jgi:hypothetical protein
MSRDIRRRSKLSGLASSDLIQEYLESLSALEVLPVTDSMHGTIIYIDSEMALYAYHSLATDTPNGTTIIQPASGVGRWFLISSASSASTPASTADRWVDPTHATVLEDIVVNDEWEVRRGNLIIEASLTVDTGGNVYVTTGFDETKRPDFFQSNVLPADTWRSIPAADHLVMHTTATKPFVVDGHLNVHGDLICINFFNV